MGVRRRKEKKEGGKERSVVNRMRWQRHYWILALLQSAPELSVL
jgi:hypothetical protein